MSKFYVSYNFQDKLERTGFGSCRVNFNCDKITTEVMSKISCLGKFGKNHPASKGVIRINIETGEKKVYSSIKEASDDNFVTSSNISSCCHGRSKTSAGYKWIFS